MSVLAVWLILALLVGYSPPAELTSIFCAGVAVAAGSQRAGTALLLPPMEERSFAIGLACSKGGGLPGHRRAGVHFEHPQRVIATRPTSALTTEGRHPNTDVLQRSR